MNFLQEIFSGNRRVLWRGLNLLIILSLIFQPIPAWALLGTQSPTHTGTSTQTTAFTASTGTTTTTTSTPTNTATATTTTFLSSNGGITSGTGTNTTTGGGTSTSTTVPPTTSVPKTTFNGTSDYYEIRDQGSDPTRNAYTLSAWVKLDSLSDCNIIVRTNAAGPLSQFSHQIRIQNGKFQHYLYTNDGGRYTLVNDIAVEAGKWYFVVAEAQTNGQIKLYVNGQELSKLFVNGQVQPATYQVRQLWTGGDRYDVGIRSGNLGEGGLFGYFRGSMNNVRVDGRVLAASEIANRFQQEKNQFVTREYDTSGRLVRYVDPQRGTYQMDWSRLTATLTDLRGNVIETWAYLDAQRDEGRRSIVANLRGFKTVQEAGGITKYIDANDRVMRVDYPGGTAKFLYDALGRVTKQWHSNGDSFDFQWTTIPPTVTVTRRVADGIEVKRWANPASLSMGAVYTEANMGGRLEQTILKNTGGTVLWTQQYYYSGVKTTPDYSKRTYASGDIDYYNAVGELFEAEVEMIRPLEEAMGFLRAINSASQEPLVFQTSSPQTKRKEETLMTGYQMTFRQGANDYSLFIDDSGQWIFYTYQWLTKAPANPPALPLPSQTPPAQLPQGWTRFNDLAAADRQLILDALEELKAIAARASQTGAPQRIYQSFLNAVSCSAVCFTSPQGTGASEGGGGQASPWGIGISQGTLDWARSGDVAAKDLFLRTLMHELIHYVHILQDVAYQRTAQKEEMQTRIEEAQFFNDRLYYDESTVAYFSIYVARDSSGRMLTMQKNGREVPMTYLNSYTFQGGVIDPVVMQQAMLNEYRIMLPTQLPGSHERQVLENAIAEILANPNPDPEPGEVLQGFFASNGFGLSPMPAISFNNLESQTLTTKDRNGEAVRGYQYVFVLSDGSKGSLFVDLKAAWIFYNGQWKPNFNLMADRLLSRTGITSAQYQAMVTRYNGSGLSFPATYHDFINAPTAAERNALVTAFEQAYSLDAARFTNLLGQIQHIVFAAVTQPMEGANAYHPLKTVIVTSNMLTKADAVTQLIASLTHEAVHIRDISAIPSPVDQDFLISEQSAYAESAYWSDRLGDLNSYNRYKYISDHIPDNGYTGIFAQMQDSSDPNLWAQAFLPFNSVISFLQQNAEWTHLKYVSPSPQAIWNKFGTNISGYAFTFQKPDLSMVSAFVDLSGQWINYMGQWFQWTTSGTQVSIGQWDASGRLALKKQYDNGTLSWTQQYSYAGANTTPDYSKRTDLNGDIDYYNAAGERFVEALLSRQNINRTDFDAINGYVSSAFGTYDNFLAYAPTAEQTQVLRSAISLAMAIDPARFINLGTRHIIFLPSNSSCGGSGGTGICPSFFNASSGSVVTAFDPSLILNIQDRDSAFLGLISHESKHMWNYLHGWVLPSSATTEDLARWEYSAWSEDFYFTKDYLKQASLTNYNERKFFIDNVPGPSGDFATVFSRLLANALEFQTDPMGSWQRLMAPLTSVEGFLQAQFNPPAGTIVYVSSPIPNPLPNRNGTSVQGYNLTFTVNGISKTIFVDTTGEWIFYSGQWIPQIDRIVARLLDRTSISKAQYQSMIEVNLSFFGEELLPGTYQAFQAEGTSAEQVAQFKRVLDRIHQLDSDYFVEMLGDLEHVIFTSFEPWNHGAFVHPPTHTVVLNELTYATAAPEEKDRIVLTGLVHEVTHISDLEPYPEDPPLHEIRVSEAHAYAAFAYWNRLLGNIAQSNVDQFTADHIPDNNYNGVMAQAFSDNHMLIGQAMAPLGTALDFLQQTGLTNLKYVSSPLVPSSEHGAGYTFTFQKPDTTTVTIFVDLSGQWVKYNGQWNGIGNNSLLSRDSITSAEYDRMKYKWNSTQTYTEFVQSGYTPAQEVLLNEALRQAMLLDPVGMQGKLEHIRHIIFVPFSDGTKGTMDAQSETILISTAVIDVQGLIFLLAHEATHIIDQERIPLPTMRDSLDSEARAYLENAHWMELMHFSSDEINWNRFVAAHIPDDNYQGLAAQTVRDPANQTIAMRAQLAIAAAEIYLQSQGFPDLRYVSSPVTSMLNNGSLVVGYNFIFTAVGGKTVSIFSERDNASVFYDQEWHVVSIFQPQQG